MGHHLLHHLLHRRHRHHTTVVISVLWRESGTTAWPCLTTGGVVCATGVSVIVRVTPSVGRSASTSVTAPRASVSPVTWKTSGTRRMRDSLLTRTVREPHVDVSVMAWQLALEQTYPDARITMVASSVSMAV